MDPRKLLEENLDLIERMIRFVAARNGLVEQEVEDFASIVKLKLIENDYAVIRKFEGRSKIATYLHMVVQNILRDYRIHDWGKWHASAEAKRQGDLAIRLEQLLHRDGRTIDDALLQLRARYPGITRESLERIAGTLPQRRARRRLVDVSEAEDVPVESDSEEKVLASERERASRDVAAAMRAALERIPGEDRLILQLQFESGMRVADIARSMKLDQKKLYRHIEKLLKDLRAELVRAGIDPREVADLVGREGTKLDFTVGSPRPRPSKWVKVLSRRRRRRSRDD